MVEEMVTAMARSGWVNLAVVVGVGTVPAASIAVGTASGVGVAPVAGIVVPAVAADDGGGDGSAKLGY